MKRHFIGLLVILFVFLALIGYQVIRGMQLSEGQFVYPLDDPYIHLMLAKNLATHGTWGFNPGEFASSSSSLLYTLILAFVAFIFGSSELTPLIINVIAGIALLWVLFRVLAALNIGLISTYVILVGVVFLVPLVSMVISGMEHTLQLLINTIYFFVLLKYLSKDSYHLDRQFFFLCLMSLLVVMIRFEGLFFIPIPIIYFLFTKNFEKAFLIFLSATLPVVVFGLVSVANDAYFLPNSLIIKGQRPEHFDLQGILNYLMVWVTNLYYTRHLLGPFVLLLVFFIYLVVVKGRSEFKSMTFVAIAACLIYSIAHLQLAKIGWFYRYESYLLVFTFIAFGLIYRDISDAFGRNFKAACLIILLIVCIPLYSRGYSAFKDTPLGMRNVYEQQYQMAKFIHEYYRTSAIGANDVGAITFLNEIKLVDLYGLGSTEVLKMKVEGHHTKERLAALVSREGVDVVIIYDGWFDNRIPESWVKVCEWYIKDNVVCTYDFVSFFSTSRDSTDELLRNLHEFEKGKLAKGVKAIYKID